MSNSQQSVNDIYESYFMTSKITDTGISGKCIIYMTRERNLKDPKITTTYKDKKERKCDWNILILSLFQELCH